MSPFTALPVDVQAIVFGHLQKPDLVSIIKTHRAFAGEAERYLYRSISLPVQSTVAAPFHREDPRHFMPVVEDDIVPWKSDRWDDSREQLWLRAGHSGVMTPADFRFPIDSPHVPQEYYEEWLDPIIFDNLKNLDLGKFAIMPRTIQKLLTHTKNLERLALTLRELYTTNDEHVVDLLKASKDTVRELTLREPTTADFANFGLSIAHADFTAFTHLTVLRITSSLWYNTTTVIPNTRDADFAWKRENRAAVRIHWLLPLSLVELEIQFNYPQAIFAKGASYHAQLKHLPEKLQVKGCQWFMNILQHQYRLPRLLRFRPVEVMDPFAPLQNLDVCPHEMQAKRVPVAYTPPKSVQMAFELAGVQLDTQVLPL
ncbi:hypothetical protein CC86DRAFT_401668 [Ophiobolus disseminans]|uniref:F-box domain-containing protein n=1 Tax=Ophiobolus disseminans TaxID=1469910 RepID=A0A6A7AD90_9PLEO|nr:hypothetical protein CC86DRAFT_401668 [Ophiobolus disseminans]